MENNYLNQRPKHLLELTSQRTDSKGRLEGYQEIDIYLWPDGEVDIDISWIDIYDNHESATFRIKNDEELEKILTAIRATKKTNKK